MELTDGEKKFSSNLALLTQECEPFQKLFSEMFITSRYECLKEWYRKNVNRKKIDILEKAETKWLAEKIEIESSEKDFNATDEIHLED
ncbi:hypothetical protein JTB14_013480 [Gonioctena quinquepunctata]|nr:hypothetical protein JTB14_013480 [Gonioctena quinquepunctata]